MADEGKSMAGSRIVRVGMVTLALLVAVACGDDDDAGAPTSGSSDDAATSTSDTTDGAAPQPEWIMHEADEDCECADGSEFVYFSRTADPEKVLLYFQGGGACFNPETCSFEDGTYKVTTGADDDPGDSPSGIFDLTDERNPFADWSIIFVPYCTGDVHLGDATHEYTPELTVEHNGFVNASQGLDHLLAEFPDATDVFVSGSSAGGVPAPLFAGLIADALPDADVAALADASGGYASNPLVNSTIGTLWNSDASIPDWPETAGAETGDIGIPDLFHIAGNHAPDVRMARFDNAFDDTQESFVALAGLGDEGTLLDVLDQNEQLVEGQGVPLATYVAPGDIHTILGRGALYELEVAGVSFLAWLTELVEGGVPDDVRCAACEEPSDSTTSTSTPDS